MEGTVGLDLEAGGIKRSRIINDIKNAVSEVTQFEFDSSNILTDMLIAEGNPSNSNDYMQLIERTGKVKRVLSNVSGVPCYTGPT